MYSVFLSSYTNTRESLGELEKLWKHSPAARFPTAFLVLPNFHSCLYLTIIRRRRNEYLTIILRNRAEYRLILSRRGRRPSRLKSDEIEQDNCFIIQQIDNKARNIFKSFCRHFFTSLFLPTYEAIYTAGKLLPTDDRYREHHDHIWIVLQFVE